MIAVANVSRISQTMDRIVNEINSVKRFVSARGNRTSCDIKQLLESFPAQLIRLISKSNLAARNVATIVGELSSNDPYR